MSDVQKVIYEASGFFKWLMIGILFTVGEPDLIDAIRELIFSASKYITSLIS